MRVDETSYQHASHQVLDWACAGESRYVCVANVHMVMEAHDCAKFQAIVNRADLVTPDGVPLVWMLRGLGSAVQSRVYGPDLMLHICRLAARQKVQVGFVGGRPGVLERLVENLSARFPDLQVSFTYAPPFRPATKLETAWLVETINASHTGILFVGLGCPKQERWMAALRGRINAVMLGVGAAFDFHAGVVRQAPALLQKLGLEWLFRLAVEPRRLWRRYLHHNPRFLVLALLQLIRRDEASGDRNAATGRPDKSAEPAAPEGQGELERKNGLRD
jgi:N-acetylglucosaminyldiphosphoundecaprenol N-acetyl-beta-D-mannosaminyltransferase